MSACATQIQGIIIASVAVCDPACDSNMAHEAGVSVQHAACGVRDIHTERASARRSR